MVSAIPGTNIAGGEQQIPVSNWWEAWGQLRASHGLSADLGSSPSITYQIPNIRSLSTAQSVLSTTFLSLLLLDR
jgi:hypothetical protein